MVEPATLFPVTAADTALTSDEWYTPRWLFKAAGLVFDVDVCAPVAPGAPPALIGHSTPPAPYNPLAPPPRR